MHGDKKPFDPRKRLWIYRKRNLVRFSKSMKRLFETISRTDYHLLGTYITELSGFIDESTPKDHYSDSLLPNCLQVTSMRLNVSRNEPFGEANKHMVSHHFCINKLTNFGKWSITRRWIGLRKKSNTLLLIWDELLDRLAEAQFFDFDMKSGFYQIRVCEENVKNCVVGKVWHFDSLVTSMGLCNLPKIFRTLMNM